MNTNNAQGKSNKVAATQQVKYKDTIHNKRFNIEVARYLINELKIKEPTWKDLVKELEEIYLLTHGNYPEDEEKLINALCHDNADAICNYFIFNEVYSVNDEGTEDEDNNNYEYFVEALGAQAVYAELEGKTMENLMADFNQH